MRCLAALALACSGCTSIGPCDDAAARAVVYDGDGVPAYVGQAIVIQSCGGGGYCHSEEITSELRHGAPMGLEFDVSIASTSPDLALDEVARLDRNQLALVHTRTLAWEQIRGGAMPPGGVGETILAEAPAYDFFDGAAFVPAPRLDDDDRSRRGDAMESVRNWLACRAPVIERTEPRGDMDPTTIGAIEPALPRRCADVTWPSLYATIFGGRMDDLESGTLRGGRCAFSGCHDGSERGYQPAFALVRPDDTSADAWRAAIDEVARALVDAPSESMQCGPEMIPYVTPGTPDASLLYLKLAPDPPCGERMPLIGGPLLDQRLCALREWIACGACIDAASCDTACLDAARVLCGIDETCAVDSSLPEGS